MFFLIYSAVSGITASSATEMTIENLYKREVKIKSKERKGEKGRERERE